MCQLACSSSEICEISVALQNETKILLDNIAETFRAVNLLKELKYFVEYYTQRSGQIRTRYTWRFQSRRF